MLLSLPGHFGLVATPEEAPSGFALGRVAAGQAEVLTIAVRPGARRAGLGRSLMTALMDAAAGRGAAELFLEVSEANAAARALYAGLGAAAVGRRRRYYEDGSDALVLRLDLSRPGG